MISQFPNPLLTCSPSFFLIDVLFTLFSNKGIVKSPKNLSSALAATSGKLEQEQIKDKLAQNMRNRVLSRQLSEKGILQNSSVAPTLQATATKLEMQQKTDKLKAGLDTRSSQKVLKLGAFALFLS